MPGSSSNASFIPKRGATPRRQKTRGGKVYLLTIISYILIFAALVASAGVFFYDRYTKSQLQDEVTAMNQEVSNFKQADMARVQEFDARLQKAKNRLDNSVSITSIFDALEAATIDTVIINSLLLTRNADENFVMQVSIDTNDFDSSLFQRGVFERNDTIENIEIDSLAVRTAANAQNATLDKTVSFNAFLSVPVSNIPYEVEAVTVPVAPVIPEVIEEQATSSETVVNPQEEI